MRVYARQEVSKVSDPNHDAASARRDVRRAVLAGPAGLALLLAGGGLLIRVALLTFTADDMTGSGWLFTAIACLLAGVALVLIALPRAITTDAGEDRMSASAGEDAPQGV